MLKLFLVFIFFFLFKLLVVTKHNLFQKMSIAEKNVFRLPYIPGMEDFNFPKTNDTPKAIWIVSILLHVLIAIIFIASLVNYFNTKIIHTYNLPVNNPGILLSTRNSLYFWFNVVVFVLEILILTIGSARLALFWNSLLSSMHSIVLGLAFIGRISLLILLIIHINSANSKTDPLNPANDDKYCCAYVIPNDFASTPLGCPTFTTPCLIDVEPSDLKWNSTFTTHFALTIVQLVLLLIFTIISIYVTNALPEMFSLIEVNLQTQIFTVKPFKDKKNDADPENTILVSTSNYQQTAKPEERVFLPQIFSNFSQPKRQ